MFLPALSIMLAGERLEGKVATTLDLNCRKQQSLTSSGLVRAGIRVAGPRGSPSRKSMKNLGLGAKNRVSRQLQDASRFERDSRDAEWTEVLLDVDDSAIFAEGLLARRFGHRLCDFAQGALFFGNYSFGFTYIQLVD